MKIKYLFLSCLTAALALCSLFLLVEMPLVSSSPEVTINDGVWVDEFDSPDLDARWNWLREDPTHWSLTDQPGYLRITSQRGSLFGGSDRMRNLLFTEPTLVDFVITTEATFEPDVNFQNAAIYIYQDDRNFLYLGRRYANGDEITFRHEADGVIKSSISREETATTLSLRLSTKGDLYIAAYSTDDTNWTEVGRYYVEFTDFKIGIGASSGPSDAEIPADFDYFRFTEFDRTTRYVAPGAACGGPDPCYGTIQQAVDAADDFDLIKVAAGTYSDLHQRPSNYAGSSTIVTQVVYISKSVDIQGGFTSANWTDSDPRANPTILDAGGEGRGLYIIGSIFPIIEGLYITGGDATGLGGGPLPHGAYDSGGGVFVLTATATLADNRIYNNIAYQGGGVYLSCSCWDLPEEREPTLRGNVIISNTAQSGGGISLIQSHPKINDNVISHNSAEFGGGGLMLLMAGPTASGNHISNNTAGNRGAGLSMQWGRPTLINNVIVDNQMLNDHLPGNTLYNLGAYPTLLHNTIARNSGGDGSAIFIEDLFEWARPYMTMTNNILVDQEVGIVASGISTVTIDGMLWYNVQTPVTAEAGATVFRQNEMTGDPAFAADGYHLTALSAAIDQGVDAGVIVDIDGEKRPLRLGYDLGADELDYYYLYLPMIVKEE